MTDRTDNARADLHPVVTEHQIIGTQTGKQGAGQVVPEDSVLCIKCGWMRCSDYTWHLSDALAAGRAETTTERCGTTGPNGWTCVRLPGHEGQHGHAGCFWGAETTTATDEDAAEELRAWAAMGGADTPADDDEGWLDRTILPSHVIDGRVERIEGRPERIVELVLGLLATARTRPTETTTEWGVRANDRWDQRVYPVADEEAARADRRAVNLAVVRREVTAWTEADRG